MSTKITAPVEGLNGPGVGGLQFVDSVAETDNEAVIAYCRSAGYTVEDDGAESVAPVDPESIVIPAGDLDSRITWVGAADTMEERSDRAQAIYSHEQAAGDTDLEELGARLRAVVYPDVPAGSRDSDGDGIPDSRDMDKPIEGHDRSGNLLDADRDGQFDSLQRMDAEKAEPEPEEELKGQALEDALEERGLSKTGTADEKRARVSEHDAAAKGQD